MSKGHCHHRSEATIRERSREAVVKDPKSQHCHHRSQPALRECTCETVVVNAECSDIPKATLGKLSCEAFFLRATLSCEAVV
eukprot:670106-Amphidinium_carterae.1